jgi:hypothetical protein
MVVLAAAARMRAEPVVVLHLGKVLPAALARQQAATAVVVVARLP